MTADVDLAAYCARIAYSGSLSPTLETLAALQRRHIAAIPFEGIDVLLGRRVDLTPAAVDDKIIRRGRGGYCFEQNGLFERVLRAIGFEVEGLLGRVFWMAPPGALPPRTHLALRVTIDGRPWLADVAFGANVPPRPLRLDVAGAQQTEFGAYRLTRSEGETLLEARMAGRWEKLYALADRGCAPADVEAANWYTSTFPDSIFRKALMVARSLPGRRYGLLDNRLTVRGRSGEAEHRELSAHGLAETLRDVFGLPVEESWMPVLEAAAAAPAAEPVAAGADG